MSTKKHAVKVMIGGEEYTVRSDLPPEYTREVAAYVDQALKKVLSQGPIVETHKAAILAALDITNESSKRTRQRSWRRWTSPTNYSRRRKANARSRLGSRRWRTI